MSAGTRPPLLHLGGKEAFAEYEKEFRSRHQNQFVNDVLGNRILLPGTYVPTRLFQVTRGKPLQAGAT